jgi:hypothetical protein
MFKRTLAALALVLGFGIATASAQTASVQWPTTQREAMIYALSQSGAAWQIDTMASLSPKLLIGKPMVLAYNPFDETITKIVCDSKWSLVGPDAYNAKKGAPVSIAPHTAALIPTDDFDNYCLTSLVAVTEKGSFPGILSIKGDFRNSTAISFAPSSTSPDAPKTLREAKNFVQNMPGAAWQKYMLASLQLDLLIGKPLVAVFNPLDDEIQSVTCDGQYALVGTNAYNAKKGAPVSIAPHTVVFIPTDGFDSYCTKSILAITENGSYNGVLTRRGDFTHSTAITFEVPQN